MKYLYSGPATTLTLADNKGKTLWEGALHPGRTVILPDTVKNHPHLATLVASKFLSPVEGDPAPEKIRPVKASKET